MPVNQGLGKLPEAGDSSESQRGEVRDMEKQKTQRLQAVRGIVEF